MCNSEKKCMQYTFKKKLLSTQTKLTKAPREKLTDNNEKSSKEDLTICHLKIKSAT